MKEFAVVFKEGLVKGLRSSDDNPRNSQALVTCFNLKPLEKGLRSYEPITNPLTGVSIDWPLPQLFIGQDVRVLVTGTKIYELSTWTLGTAKLTVTKVARWDFIDFGSYLLMTNGTKLAIRDYAGAWTLSDYTSTIPRFSTGCNFNGQIVAGNIQSTWHGCGTGSLIWSKIGSIDFTPDGTNEAGFRNIPVEGAVLRVKKLGKGVVTYCENMVGVLLPWQQTFGFEALMMSGLAAKGAVGGDENLQVFVDKDRNVWAISKDFNMKMLGYQEYMELMTIGNIVVEHNPVKKEFHIGDGVYGFVLTEQGLGQCYQSPSTVAVTNGVAYGVAYEAADSQARILTDTLDFGLRGLKTLQTLEAGVKHTSGNLHAVTQWRSNKTGSFNSAPSIIVNLDGVATPIVTADEFRIGLTFASYLGIELDYMNLRIKLSDKRYVRGKYNVA